MSRRPPSRAGGRRADLHSHTIFSDGLLTPEQLVARAASKGLAAIAITDHDSVEGIARGQAAAAPGLEVVPGIEISSAMEGWDLHLLGFFIDAEHGGLRERLACFQTERRERARQMLRRLEDLGVAIDEAEVLARAGPGSVGRPHVAAALVAAGHVADLDEAFRRYLGSQGAAYVARPRFHPEEAIALIHAANGVSVLAHPGPALPIAIVERLARAGLRGVEVWHPLHGVATIHRYRELASRLSLIETGGSDFHGQPHGLDLGEVTVPTSVVERLKRVAGVAG